MVITGSLSHGLHRGQQLPDNDTRINDAGIGHFSPVRDRPPDGSPDRHMGNGVGPNADPDRASRFTTSSAQTPAGPGPPWM